MKKFSQDVNSSSRLPKAPSLFLVQSFLQVFQALQMLLKVLPKWDAVPIAISVALDAVQLVSRVVQMDALVAVQVVLTVNFSGTY